MKQTKYIFRWKQGLIEVRPSWNYTKEAVWEFAIDQLRPAGMSDEEAAEFIREHGEVVEIENN